MRLTIIRDDGVVGIGGVFRSVDLSTLPAGVRAVQWSGSAGHIEYLDMSNEEISSIADFQVFVDAWEAAAPVITPPEPPGPPVVISMRQARLALHQSGYLSQVDTLIDGMGEDARITWDYATEVRRNHPLVSSLAAQLPLTDQQLDALFTLGATL